ncbi:MAG: AhpC/TSA family protein [Planctomycetes bacterium]|nr:AhpC/TSA family protein [Planctomycetota bacterium]
MRRERELDPELPAPLFFTLGAVEPTRAFLAKLWPEARAIADPAQRFYAAFELGHGSAGKYLGPGVWAAGLRALLKGNGVGRPVGDPLTLPGLFLVHDRQLVAAHEFRHAGDHPDWRAVSARLKELAGSPT